MTSIVQDRTISAPICGKFHRYPVLWNKGRLWIHDEWSGNTIFADTIGDLPHLSYYALFLTRNAPTGYAAGLHEPRYLPVNIKTPLSRLTGE